ncbi:hypothetical protein FOT57_22435 [Serratia ureilytica]|uniref:hypothetical protein n=1 Tax=Serratia ureilytica TaxID=300181 RepID=UPI0011C7CAA5|nr:hypothetical protein [Serratia ureilytica]TXE51901.1 hypothetical protein FOT57_22435 [Serratia ureilytica]
MNRMNLLCAVVPFVKHQTEQRLPYASVGATLARLEEGALFLQRILAGLEQATRNIQRMCNSEDKLAVDKIVFCTLQTLGHRQFYGLGNQRLLRMGLRQVIKLGNQLDPELWQCGYDDAYGNGIESMVELGQDCIS